MAGASNRAFKAAGIPKKAMAEIRVKASGPLTIHSAIQIAKQHGIALPEKALQRGAQRPDGPKAQPPPGWQAAARGDTRRAAEGAQRLADYRKAAEGHQRASDEGKRANRTAIREQLRKLGEVDIPMRRFRSDDADIAAAVAQLREVNAGLAGLLRSRDNIAKARKAERTPGQQDLFGVPQPKRAESPFERKVAARNAMLAAAGERAKRLAPAMAGVARNMRQARQMAARNTTNENRAAMIGAKLLTRTANLGDPRADRARDRLRRVMSAYPKAGPLAYQLHQERSLDLRTAVRRITKSTMGRSLSRDSFGLPATRSERIAGLLSSMGRRDEQASARKAAVKGPKKAPGGRQRRAA